MDRTEIKMQESSHPGNEELYWKTFRYPVYSDKELEEFESLIRLHLEEAEIDCNLIDATLSRHNNDGGDSEPTFIFSDDAIDVFTKEQIISYALSLKNYIGQLRYSLRQIKSKTYGKCSISGQKIPRERLLIAPHTTMCEQSYDELSELVRHFS